MKVVLGADHGGYRLKQQLAEHLRTQGHEVLDVGTSSDEAVDYPVYAEAVARKVASGTCDRGIMIDGAGTGSAMAANKVPGVRAALAYDLSSALNSREHNDANVLTLGAGLIGPALAQQIVDAWLAAECTAERHLKRVALIGQIESSPSDAPARSTDPGRRPGGDDTSKLDDADLERIARQLESLLDTTTLTRPAAGAGQWAPPVGGAPETARKFVALGV